MGVIHGVGKGMVLTLCTYLHSSWGDASEAVIVVLAMSLFYENKRSIRYSLVVAIPWQAHNTIAADDDVQC